jgi:hypothetical protein
MSAGRDIHDARTLQLIRQERAILRLARPNIRAISSEIHKLTWPPQRCLALPLQSSLTCAFALPYNQRRLVQLGSR